MDLSHKDKTDLGIGNYQIEKVTPEFLMEITNPSFSCECKEFFDSLNKEEKKSVRESLDVDVKRVLFHFITGSGVDAIQRKTYFKKKKIIASLYTAISFLRANFPGKFQASVISIGVQNNKMSFSPLQRKVYDIACGAVDDNGCVSGSHQSLKDHFGSNASAYLSEVVRKGGAISLGQGKGYLMILGL